MASPIGAALLGTGLFAKDIYKNNFRATAGEVQLRVVWSRTIESAQSFVTEFFQDSGAAAVAGEEALEGILGDASIRLVVVVLPVQVALPIVARCLAAGKAVVQEKPVGPTAAAAAGAITAYRSTLRAAPSPRGAPLWMFAENYRFEAVFGEACRRVSEIGKIIKLDLVADLPMDEKNKYYASAWRRDVGGCPGGFLMDSAVHFIAALRLLAGAAGLGQAASASAHGLQAKPDLSPPDSLVGVALFGEGVPASVSISLAAHHVRWSLVAVGTAGTLEVSRGGWAGGRGEYTLSVQTQAHPAVTQTRFAFSGCQDEWAEFVGLVRRADAGEGAAAASASASAPGPAARSSPEEGARDLALLEALLASAAQGGQAVRVAQL